MYFVAGAAHPLTTYISHHSCLTAVRFHPRAEKGETQRKRQIQDSSAAVQYQVLQVLLCNCSFRWRRNAAPVKIGYAAPLRHVDECVATTTDESLSPRA